MTESCSAKWSVLSSLHSQFSFIHHFNLNSCIARYELYVYCWGFNLFWANIVFSWCVRRQLLTHIDESQPNCSKLNSQIAAWKMFYLHTKDCWWGMNWMNEYHSALASVCKLDNVWNYSIISSCWAPYIDYEPFWLKENVIHNMRALYIFIVTI